MSMISRKLSMATRRYGNRGYVMLLSVLVVGAVAIAVAVSLVLLGVDFSRSGFAIEQSSAAKGLANACAETALEQIRESPSFSGVATLALGDGTCTYTVIVGSGQNRTVNASGTVGTVVRKVKITLDTITPKINITSWQEVADF